MNSEAPKTTVVPHGGEDHSPPRERCSFLSAAVLRNRLVLMFCLFALIAIVANIKLVLDVGSEISEISNVSANETVAGYPAERSKVLNEIRNKMLALLAITIVSFGAIIFLYVRRVVDPLNAISVTIKEISRGNLSVTAPTGQKDDVGDLGGAINDLAANFQEVLLLTGTTVGNFRCSLETMERILELDKNSPSGRHAQEQLEAIKKDLELLGSIVEAFEFYHTHFDGRKVVPFSSRPKT
jgi:methyl-accepting chemotaxis protein